MPFAAQPPFFTALPPFFVRGNPLFKLMVCSAETWRGDRREKKRRQIFGEESPPSNLEGRAKRGQIYKSPPRNSFELLIEF